MLLGRRKRRCFASSCEMHSVNRFAVLLIVLQALVLRPKAAELSPDSSGEFSASGSGSAGIINKQCMLSRK